MLRRRGLQRLDEGCGGQGWGAGEGSGGEGWGGVREIEPATSKPSEPISWQFFLTKPSKPVATPTKATVSRVVKSPPLTSVAFFIRCGQKSEAP